MYEYLAEFIGTFIFISVILLNPTPIAIGIALIAAIFFSANISGGHINPCVSFVFYLKNTLSTSKFIGYVISQLLGGLCAYYFVKSQKSIKE
jgi:glycerol uptake facilitator-like aquaporin